MMKQLDKRTEWRLNWLVTPLVLIAVVMMLDLFLDLNMGSLRWGKPALLVGVAIPAIGFSIAYIRQRCWGLLAATGVMLLILLLNMSNLLVEWLA